MEDGSPLPILILPHPLKGRHIYDLSTSIWVLSSSLTFSSSSTCYAGRNLGKETRSSRFSQSSSDGSKSIHSYLHPNHYPPGPLLSAYQQIPGGPTVRKMSKPMSLVTPGLKELLGVLRSNSLWVPQSRMTTSGPLLLRVSWISFQTHSVCPRVKVARIYFLWKLKLHKLFQILYLHVHFCKGCDPMLNQFQTHPKPRKEQRRIFLYIISQIEFSIFVMHLETVLLASQKVLH